MVQPLEFFTCLNHKPLIMKEEEKVAHNVDARIIIDQVLKTLGVNAPTFAREIGVNYQRIFDLQRGRTKKFNPGMVNKICEVYPQINKSYLYSGEGEVSNGMSSSEHSNISNPTNPAIDYNNMAEFMGMSSKLLSLFEQLQAKSSALMEKEAMLNERERILNEREIELMKMTHQAQPQN